MNEGTIRMVAKLFSLVAEIQAIIVEVEGMKAENTERELKGFSLAYLESAFRDAGEKIRFLAHRLRTEI